MYIHLAHSVRRWVRRCSVLDAVNLRGQRYEGTFPFGLQLVRENIFKRLYKEVPYNLDILDVSIKHLRDGSIRIEKHIMVPSEQASSIVGINQTS